MKNVWDSVAEFMEAGGQIVGQNRYDVGEQRKY